MKRLGGTRFPVFACMATIACIARSECPPRSKKLSCVVTSSTRNCSRQISASDRSVSEHRPAHMVGGAPAFLALANVLEREQRLVEERATGSPQRRHFARELLERDVGAGETIDHLGLGPLEERHERSIGIELHR